MADKCVVDELFYLRRLADEPMEAVGRSEMSARIDRFYLRLFDVSPEDRRTYVEIRTRRTAVPKGVSRPGGILCGRQVSR